MRRRVLLTAALALLAVTVTGRSDANFNATSANPGNSIAAAAMESYVRLYSQGSDPDGLTGYATRNGSAPVTPAASGVDRSLTAHLGGYDNVNNTDVFRVFTVKAATSLPVASVTVALTPVADAATGGQPISQVYFSTVGSTANAGVSATLTAGQKRQVNVRVRTRTLTANTLYAPAVRVTVTYPGFTGTFFSYDVITKVYDGPGAGPS
jgi:hypothetical protein